MLKIEQQKYKTNFKINIFNICNFEVATKLQIIFYSIFLYLCLMSKKIKKEKLPKIIGTKAKLPQLKGKLDDLLTLALNTPPKKKKKPVKK